MLFNSFTYLIFLAAVVAVYYLLPQKYRNVFLLVSSYAFYMWAVPWYGALLLLCTLFSFFAAKRIASSENQRLAKRRLAFAIIIPLALLALFKYFDFLADGAALLTGAAKLSELTLILPAGLSFYTFQIIGYAVDVYKKRLSPETKLVDYALFVSFFPQILSGPIGRAGELLPQYKTEHKLSYSQTVSGLQRFLTGAFKKVVVADGLALIADGVYGGLSSYTGAMLWLGAICYALQIYFDFSGYTDMALGSAALLGFELRENFRAPYLSSSLGEFWGRWHMSLMSWFRDYIYIPLGGNRKGFARKLLNVAVVFLISGLWHGSDATFLLWGAWLAFFRVLEELVTRAEGNSKPRRDTALSRFLGALYTDAVVVFGWIFFRAATVSDALYVFKNLFVPSSAPFFEQLRGIAANAMTTMWLTNYKYFAVFYFGGIALSLVIAALLDARTAKGFFNPLERFKSKSRWLLYWAMELAVIFFYFMSNASGGSRFVYLGF